MPNYIPNPPTHASLNWDSYVVAADQALDAAIAAQNSAFVSVGQTSVDVSNYGDDLVAAMTAQGQGKRYLLNKPTYTIPNSSTVTLSAGTVIEGVGSAVSKLAVASGRTTALIKTTGFDTLTGTNPASGTLTNVVGFALRRISVDGTGCGANCPGVQLYGAGYDIDDLSIHNFTGTGFYSEWTNVQSTDPQNGRGTVARIRGLDTYNNGGSGIYFNGPIDSQLSNLISGVSGAKGLWIGSKAFGTQVHMVHAWGTGNTHAVYIEGSDCILSQIVAEGASTAQVLVGAHNTQISGLIYPAGGATKGVLIGDASHTAIKVSRIHMSIESCITGAVDFTYDGGGNELICNINQSSGTPYIGTANAATTAILTISGGVSGGNGLVFLHASGAYSLPTDNAGGSGNVLVNTIGSQSLGYKTLDATNTYRNLTVASDLKPTVTGSRGGSAALASLVTALAGLGILTDGTSV